MADTTNKTQNLVDDGKFSAGFGAGPRHDKRMSVVGPDKLGAKQEQGSFAVAREPTKTVPKNSNPANAPAAPTGRTGYLFTGLAEALNTYQNDLVKKKIVSKADIYEFEFVPIGLGATTVKKPGSTDRSKTAGKTATTAKEAKDPKTDKVNNNSQNWSIEPGTQIIQVIDQIMRSSNFVTDQATSIVDPVTQKVKPSPGTGTGQTVWYNITVDATMLDYDEKRRDYAYRMKFIITPYAITQMASEYFPDSKYRGSHKSFNYWFTGQNTQILSYEQTYNNLYKIVLSGEASTKAPLLRDHRDQYTKIPMPTTEQKTGQQTGTYTNAAADSAADFLYSPGELAKVRMKIIGDPAFLQQDIIETGLNNQSFNFRPFNNDGSINFNSSQIIFDIIWNQPDDYDFETGVVSPYKASGRAKQYNAYILTEVKSHFSRGRFEQDIEGNLLIEYETEAKPAEVRPPVQKVKAKPKATPPDRSREYALKGFKGTDLPPVGTDTVGAFVGYRSPGIRRKTLLDPNGYGDS
jgi:hypothetical protein